MVFGELILRPLPSIVAQGCQPNRASPISVRNFIRGRSDERIAGQVGARAPGDFNSPRYNWRRFETNPEPNLNGRSIPIPQVGSGTAQTRDRDREVGSLALSGRAPNGREPT
jgi:hypothetical protein